MQAVGGQLYWKYTLRVTSGNSQECWLATAATRSPGASGNQAETNLGETGDGKNTLRMENRKDQISWVRRSTDRILRWPRIFSFEIFVKVHPCKVILSELNFDYMCDV